MTISPEQFEKIAGLLLGSSNGENPISSVRANFPGLTVTRCDAEDMRGEKPFVRAGNYDVFLVNTSNHCWQIIDELADAGGLVLAKLN